MALSCVGLGLEFELELGLGLMLMMLFDLFGFADAVCHYFDLCASFVHCTKGKHIASHRTHTQRLRTLAACFAWQIFYRATISMQWHNACNVYCVVPLSTNHIRFNFYSRWSIAASFALYITYYTMYHYFQLILVKHTALFKDVFAADALIRIELCRAEPSRAEMSQAKPDSAKRWYVKSVPHIHTLTQTNVYRMA